MSTPKGVFKGGKLNNTHSSLIKASVPIIKALKRAGFNKIRPNQIARGHRAQRRCEIEVVRAGLRLVIHDTDATQVFHIYTGQIEVAVRTIDAAWQRHYDSSVTS